MASQLNKYTSARNKTPHLFIWQKELSKEKEASYLESFISKIQAHYLDLYSARKRYTHAALNMHLENYILPVMSLYLSLLDEGQNQDIALHTTEHLFLLTLKNWRKRLRLLGRLPFFFHFIRWSVLPIINRYFPPEGWETEWVERSADCVAFKMHRCFYLDVLTEYRVPELTPIFCLGDDFLYDGVSPFLIWDRSKTLGRRDNYCDFHFYRAAK